MSSQKNPEKFDSGVIKKKILTRVLILEKNIRHIKDRKSVCISISNFMSSIFSDFIELSLT